MKIKKYLEYIWEEKNRFSVIISFTISIHKITKGYVASKLSTSLANDFIFEVSYGVLKQSKLFRERFSKKLVYRASTLMKEVIVPPEEIVFHVKWSF
jgi:hypothetical protein